MASNLGKDNEQVYKNRNLELRWLKMALKNL